MHIHGTPPNPNGINPYAAAADKAAAGQRAANVRKKLLKSANDTERVASPEEASLLAKWMNQPTPEPTDAEYHSDLSGKDSSFG